MPSKLDDLPTYVQDRLLNEDLYRVNIGVLELYNVSSDDNNRGFAQIINKVFFKEIPFYNFADTISQDLKISLPIAQGIAFEYTSRVFKDLDNFYPDVHMNLQKWGQSKAAPENNLPENLSRWDSGEFLKNPLPTTPEFTASNINESLVQGNQNQESASNSPSLKELLSKATSSNTNTTEQFPAGKELVLKPGEIALTIEEALYKNPRVGEVLITSEALKMLNYSNLQRPTIRNWLKDYDARIGKFSHSLNARINYLTESENTRELDEDERIILDLILKSYDNKEKIIFNNKWELIIDERSESEFSANNINQQVQSVSQISKPTQEEIQKELDSFDNNIPANLSVTESPQVFENTDIMNEHDNNIVEGNDLQPLNPTPEVVELPNSFTYDETNLMNNQFGNQQVNQGFGLADNLYGESQKPINSQQLHGIFNDQTNS